MKEKHQKDFEKLLLDYRKKPKAELLRLKTQWVPSKDMCVAADSELKRRESHSIRIRIRATIIISLITLVVIILEPSNIRAFFKNIQSFLKETLAIKQPQEVQKINP